MKQVEIYTSDTCPQCVKAKEILKNNKVEYVEYNISKDIESKKRLIGMGYMSIPLTVIDGEHVLGLDIKRMMDLLNK